MQIEKDFTFDSAHFLPNVPESHKCRRLHGHTYKATIIVEGELLADQQWIIDFAEIKSIVKPVIDRLDHHFLNAVPGLENPTVERIAQYLYEEIKPLLPLLSGIKVEETPTSRCTYHGKN